MSWSLPSRAAAGCLFLAAAIGLGPVPLAAVRGESALSLDSEVWMTDDIRLSDTVLAYGSQVGKFRGRATVSFSTIGFDYQPVDVDLGGVSRDVRHNRYSGQFLGRHAVHPKLTLIAGAGGYSGFTGYRSAWISEWYQQFFAGLPGLERAEPHGANVTVGARLEYLPAAGFAEVQYTYARDVIAPAYDEVLDDIEGLVGVRAFRDRLNTQALQVSSENIWHRRLRTRMEFRFTSQSEREVRLAAVGAAHWAFCEEGVLRLDGGWVRERIADDATGVSPGTFRGWWLGAAFEWRLSDAWRLSVGGRRYHDTGEIENSIGFSSSAPPVDTWHANASIRWIHGAHTVKLGGGPYFVDYAPVSFANLFFGNLYQDRSAAVVQLAYEWNF